VLLLLVAGVLAAASPLPGQARASIILATTTSTQDSGLLDVLVPRFETAHGIDVKVIAVGTGAALRMAASGDADVVLVHAPDAERAFVTSGDLIEGRLVMHNDFVLVGPFDDPAGVRRHREIVAAMRSIAARGAFVSRGDSSGTHLQELALWARAGVDPSRVAQRARLQLAVVFQGDPALRNPYHVYAVNPARHPRAQLGEAKQFIGFLVSPAVQQAIAAFRRDQFGESLFVPDAVPPARR
jgi:tungstate transport system substrate-binding protein